MRGRPRSFEVEPSPREREQLDAFAGSRTLPHGPVRRAQIMLRSAAGVTNRAIARSPGASIPLVVR